MSGPRATENPLPASRVRRPSPRSDRQHTSAWMGAILDGRYLVLRHLERGGMANVFEALDERCDRPVVVKAPHTALQRDPDFRRRFEHEIRSQTELDHPNIAKVLDRGEHEGAPFVVIQHLGGGSLADRIEAFPTGQPPDTVLTWLPAVAGALDYVHARGLIHRDVKPANILFDVSGYAFLSDFGIAKAPEATDPGLTRAGVVLGTPGYVAPELGMDSPATPATDQYALAATVYEALSGELPYASRYPAVMLASRRLLEPRPLREVAPGIPEALAAVVMRGLDRDPAARHPSCRSFAQAFAESLPSGCPVSPAADVMRIPAPWLLFPVTAGLVVTVLYFIVLSSL